MIFNPYTLSFLGTWGQHTEIWTQYTTIIHSHFWRLGDVGTVPRDKHTEIETQYTPLYTLIFGDVGAAAMDIHTEIGTQYTTTHTLSFLETWGRGDSTQGYTFGVRDTIYHTYTLSFLETWGRGDSTQGYTYGERDTIYHHYTLSFWRLRDVGTAPMDIDTDIET